MKINSSATLPASVTFTTLTTKRLVVTGTASVSQSVKNEVLSNKNWKVLANGTHLWGPGDATYDLNLYRVAAGVLKTDTSFQAGGGITAGVGLANQISLDSTQGRIYIGSAGDAYLYRAGAAQLKTDGAQLTTTGFIYVPPTATGAALANYMPGEAQPRFYIDFAGVFRWGPGGATVTDTLLYRAAAGIIQTDGRLIADLQSSAPVVTTARTGGAAAALPANPVSYIPVFDSGGNRRYIPAYS